MFRLLPLKRTFVCSEKRFSAIGGKGSSDQLREIAHVLLPIGTFAETSGTSVNLEGQWQSQSGAAQPVGEARPVWKVLRVLGNLLNLEGFEYQSSEDVREELKKLSEAQDTEAQGGTAA